jgi:hypothetical protein
MAGFRLTFSALFPVTVVVDYPSVLFSEENRALLGYYPTSRGNFLPTFRDNLYFTSSGVKNPKIVIIIIIIIIIDP